jgi:hypothetical protein
MMKKKLQVIIVGTGIHEDFEALAHEMIANPAGTYHKFTLANGVVLLYNDFGVRSVLLRDM